MNEELSWTAGDDADAHFEALPTWEPAFVMDVFRTALGDPDMRDDVLRMFVTPESLPTWGDFSELRASLKRPLRTGLLSRRAIGALDVAYVRLVTDQGPWLADPPEHPTDVVVSLVWRDDLRANVSFWRIHEVGSEGRAPSQLPRAADAHLRAPL